MSIESWKAIAYPVPAVDATETWMQAIEHSLLKWRNLTPEILEQHKVCKVRRGIVDPNINHEDFFVADQTCAMCAKVASNCRYCIGYEANKKACSGSMEKNIIAGDAYEHWVNTGETGKMLEWLEKALIYAKNERQGRGI